MTSKKLISLSIVAGVLVAAAYLSNTKNTVKTPATAGKPLLKKIDLSQVAAIEIDNETAGLISLVSTDAGWIVESMHGYPADISRIRQALLKLNELKIGHTAEASKLGDRLGKLEIKDAFGTTLATLRLGKKRMRSASAETSPFGGGAYPDGRYVATPDSTVLISDTLDAFDGDDKQWINTKIAAIPASDVATIEISGGSDPVSLTKTNGVWSILGITEDEDPDSSKFYNAESALSYLNLNGIADPALTPDLLGLTTGTVFKATLTNGETYTATIGNAVSNSTDRYFRLSAAFTPVSTNDIENAAVQKKIDTFNAEVNKWTYLVSSNNAERMMKTRADFIKAKPKSEPEVNKPTNKTPAE